MSTSSELSASPWDATPRDRLVTRGLLMGLSRRRRTYFAANIPTSILVAIFTLGLRPLWIASVRVERWRRYEWILLGEFAKWWHARTNDADARRLADDADRFATPWRPDRPVVAAMIYAVLLVGIAFHRGGWPAALDTVFRPQSLSTLAFAYSAVLSIAWLVVLLRGTQQHARANAWIEELNLVMAADGRRPVPSTRSRIPWIWFALAGLIAVVGPTWAAMMVAVLAMQNDLINSLRPVRLALVERVLERMDTSGLPIEYDIESTSPEAFAMAGGQ